MNCSFIFVGITGSGKTAQARNIVNELGALYYSRTLARLRFAVDRGVLPDGPYVTDPFEQPDHEYYSLAANYCRQYYTLFNEFSNDFRHGMLERAMKERKHVVIDTINLRRSERLVHVREAKSYGLFAHGIFFDTPIRTCAFNVQAARFNDARSVWTQHKKLQRPIKSEFDDLTIVKG